MKDQDQAASVYSTFLKELEAQQITDPDNQPICYKFLANYHLARGKLDDAYNFAQSCLECDTFSIREEAKSILKQISVLRERDMQPSPVLSGLRVGIIPEISTGLTEDWPIDCT